MIIADNDCFSAVVDYFNRKSGGTTEAKFTLDQVGNRHIKLSYSRPTVVLSNQPVSRDAVHCCHTYSQVIILPRRLYASLAESDNFSFDVKRSLSSCKESSLDGCFILIYAQTKRAKLTCNSVITLYWSVMLILMWRDGAVVACSPREHNMTGSNLTSCIADEQQCSVYALAGWYWQYAWKASALNGTVCKPGMRCCTRIRVN